MAHDSAEKLREALERRRSKNASPEGLQRIPFQLDMELADRAEATARQINQLEDWLDELHARAEERDPESVDDIRASGHDLSEVGQQIAETEAEVERLRAALEALLVEAKASELQLVFRRASADEYERLLIAAGGVKVETDAAATYAFHNSLVERCFLRAEFDGQDAEVGTWSDYVKSAELTFGELDPIRALVYAANKRGGNSIPFSSTPSKRTRRR